MAVGQNAASSQWSKEWTCTPSARWVRLALALDYMGHAYNHHNVI